MPVALTVASLLLAPQAPARNIQVAARIGNGFSPSEPSVAIHPRNPDQILIGVILDRAISSRDGGKTWTDVTLKSTYGVHGDPVVAIDPQGRSYFLHLAGNRGGDTWLDRIVCQTSDDGGLTWNGVVGIGHNPPKDQDKQWVSIHPDKPHVYATWTQFDKYGAKEPEYHSNIMFSRSTDRGQTWSKSIAINDISGDCIDSDGTTEGAVPTVGPDGTVHVVWSNQGVLWYDRSKDDGQTWLPYDRPITRQFGGWDMEIPGVGRCNGMPVLVADRGRSRHRGNLYVLFADQRAGVTDTDIFLIRSTDGGETWTKPLRVNQDPKGKHQFFPWLAVDESTGYLYAVYYDRRAYADNQTDVYVAYSTDGGQTFKERKISERPFTPVDGPFFGDYNNIAAVQGRIVPVWTRMDDRATTVWTTILSHEDLVRP